MILALATLALAMPDRLTVSAQVGQSLVDVAVAEDAYWAGFLDTAGILHLLDLGTWEITDVVACTDPGGVAVSVDDGGAVVFWVGCGDGTVVPVPVDDTRLPDTVAGDGVAVGDGAGPVVAVEVATVDGQENVYAVIAGETETLVDAFVRTTGAELSGFPTSAFVNEGVEDTVVAGNVMIVVNGGTETTKVDLSSGSVTTDTETLSGRDFVDGFNYAGTSVYLADATDGGIVKLTTSTGNYDVALNDALATVTAVALSESGGWFATAGEDDDGEGVVSLRTFSSGTVAVDASATVTGTPDITELDVAGDYLFGAATDGMLHIVTDVPWVQVTSEAPDLVVTGQDLSITFQSDVEGSYKVYVGDEPAGVAIAEGDVEADTETTVEIEVGDDWDEGRNRVWVVVTSTAGALGHDAIDYEVNNPPEGVDAWTTFGNERLVVEIEGLDVEDLGYYCIYVTTTPFDPEDYDTGGPEFDGTDPIVAPLRYTADPGDDVVADFSPVTNGQPYYVAVRAVDSTGLEGPMTDLMTATPEETYSVSQLIGEDGGFFCGTAPSGGMGTPAGALAVAAAALLARRRRRGAGALVVAALVAPGIAHAKPAKEETPITSHIAVRYGVFLPQDEYIQRGFGDNTNKVFRLDYGWSGDGPVLRLFEADLGIGIVQEKGYLYTDDGTKSADTELLQMLPVVASFTLRLNLVDEQIIVPFIRGGGDAWLWRETWDPVNGSSDDGVRYGGKLGGHWGAGGALLLDALDPRGASRLEARTGVNDTYLVGEYRRTYMVHGENQIDLSAAEVTFGLKFDF